MVKSSEVALAFAILMSACSNGADTASQTSASGSAATSTSTMATSVAATVSTVAESTTSTRPPLSSGDFQAPFVIAGPSAAHFVVVANPTPEDEQSEPAADFVHLYSSQIMDASVFVTTSGHDTVDAWLSFLTTHGQLTVTAEGTSEIGGLTATYVDIITDAEQGVVLYEGPADSGSLEVGDAMPAPAFWFASAGLPMRAYLIEVDGQAVAMFADDPTNIELATFLKDVEAAFTDWRWSS